VGESRVGWITARVLMSVKPTKAVG
jgi:hypothetical protein